MDAWKNAFFLQEKPKSIKFLLLGGGGLGFGGGGECRFYFYGRADFSDRLDAQSGARFFARMICAHSATKHRCDFGRATEKALLEELPTIQPNL